MSDEGGQPAGVAPPGGAPAPPPAAPAPGGYGGGYGAPAPPPPPPPPIDSGTRRTRRPARTVGGIIGVIVIIGIKLFALAGISRLLHGASPVLIFIVLIAVAILLRRLFHR